MSDGGLATARNARLNMTSTLIYTLEVLLSLEIRDIAIHDVSAHISEFCNFFNSLRF